MEEAEHQTRGLPAEERLAAIGIVRNSWEPLVLGYNSVRAAMRLWVDTLILLAAADDEGDVMEQGIDAARNLLAAWNPLVDSMHRLGLSDIPRLPDIVTDIINEGAEE